MSVVAAPQSQMRYSLDARHVIINGTPLPDNILCTIFQFLAEERARYRGGYYKIAAVDVVPLVCQRWRAIATVKPRLWNTIVFHDHTSAISVQRKLSLSQQSRLKINIQQTDPNNGNSLQDYVACARLLAKEAWRIQTFMIRGFNCASLAAILKIFSMPAPELRELYVVGLDGVQPTGTEWPPLFGMDMPRLQSVTVVESAVPLYPGSFQNLIRLRLLSQGNLDFYALIMLLDALPSLRWLAVKMKRYSEWDPDTKMYTGTIALNNLRELYIEGCQDNVLRVLAPLAFPDTAQVYVTIYGDNDNIPRRYRQRCTHMWKFTRNLRTVNLAYVDEVSNGLVTRTISITWNDPEICVKWVWSAAEDKSEKGQPGFFFDMVLDLQKVEQINITRLPTVYAVHPLEWRHLLELVPALTVLLLRMNTHRPLDGPEGRTDFRVAEMEHHILLAHFSTLWQELGVLGGQGPPLLCPNFRSLQSPRDWILFREFVQVCAPHISARAAAGASMVILRRGEDMFSTERPYGTVSLIRVSPRNRLL